MNNLQSLEIALEMLKFTKLLLYLSQTEGTIIKDNFSIKYQWIIIITLQFKSSTIVNAQCRWPCIHTIFTRIYDHFCRIHEEVVRFCTYHCHDLRLRGHRFESHRLPSEASLSKTRISLHYLQYCFKPGKHLTWLNKRAFWPRVAQLRITVSKGLGKHSSARRITSTNLEEVH